MKKNIFSLVLIAVFMLMPSFPILTFAEDSNKAATLIQLAENLISKGDLVQAEINIKKAIDIVKDDPWELRVSARLHRIQFEKTNSKTYVELAQTEIERSLKDRPNDLFANEEAALIYYDLNNMAKAAKAIEIALKLGSKNEQMQVIKKQIQSSNRKQ